MARPTTDPKASTLHLRLQEHNRARLEALAKATSRSMSWHAQQALEQYLAQHQPPTT